MAQTVDDRMHILHLPHILSVGASGWTDARQDLLAEAVKNIRMQRQRVDEVSERSRCLESEGPA